MSVYWSSAALADLERIWHCHADHDIDRADRIEQAITETTLELEQMPNLGRAGRVADTREYLMSGEQYVISFRPRHDGVGISRVESTRERQ